MPRQGTSHDAAAIMRLTRRKQRLTEELRLIEQALATHGNRLSAAHGYCVPLRNEALFRLACAA